MSTETAVAGQSATGGEGPAPGSPLFRFLFVHEIDDYPANGRRTGYLALAVLATIVLYYTYYTQTGVTPNILQNYHMSFSFYVWIVIISNLIGAFASLPASKTDKLGRANVIIYGLLIIGLLVAVGVPLASGEWGFATVICALGLVEGAILVATSSNNVVKIVYAIAYSGMRMRTVPVAALAVLAACGVGIAVVF